MYLRNLNQKPKQNNGKFVSQNQLLNCLKAISAQNQENKRQILIPDSIKFLNNDETGRQQIMKSLIAQYLWF